MLARKFPLPKIDADADKEERGSVLVVAGGSRVAGAAVLAGEAALRAGAGRLQIATARSATMHVAIAVPEALVLPATTNRPSRELREFSRAADCVLIGPGLPEGAASVRMARVIARSMPDEATLVLDAASLGAAGTRTPCVITPHAGEMARLLDVERAEVDGAPEAAARTAGERFGGVCVLKGPRTFVASNDGMFLFDDGPPGLATSGSGDVLAGTIAGLAARGADPLTAALWGVWAHAAAARRAEPQFGRLGFLARDLLCEIPGALYA
jgi:hydroxyethylthiazole kinase-like uncharacterized protein yjeF